MNEIAGKKTKKAAWVRPTGLHILVVGLVLLVCLCESGIEADAKAKGLVVDGSFEISKTRDRYGLVFEHWLGWTYSSDAHFEVSRLSHSGKQSCLLVGGSEPKIRVYQELEGLEPGRYKVTAFIRGLDVGTGQWKQTTEFAFAEKYFPLEKNGTFGWTPLTYVADVKSPKKFQGPSFGLLAPGRMWVDDVKMERVDKGTPVTEKPVLGTQLSPIASSEELGKSFHRCPVCQYRNSSSARSCYACGHQFGEKQNPFKGPETKRLESFERNSPFSGAKVVSQGASHGKRSLKLSKGYTAWQAEQDWQGYDELRFDLNNPGPKPFELRIEIRDRLTTNYWNRVNRTTSVAPGKSTVSFSLDQLYVGEKSRPGRGLILGGITRIVFGIDDDQAGEVFIDNLRLVRDRQLEDRKFDGLYAFDFGTSKSPLMPGFSRIDPSMSYSKGRGFGLKDAGLWRTFDALQPDPLYQDFICIERGGIAVDVPNGIYRVFLNIDSPTGYWGEYQRFRSRGIIAEGHKVVHEEMNFGSFLEEYFQNFGTEDLSGDNTFDKYVASYFSEKKFDVEVRDGQLNIDFVGKNFACSLSAAVIYPVTKSSAGEQFLRSVVAKRRFYFDNSFKKVVPGNVAQSNKPTPRELGRGYTVFHRHYSKDVNERDVPSSSEVGAPVVARGFSGELEPLTVTISPHRDLGQVSFTIGELVGPSTIPASSFSSAFVSYRLARKTYDGSIYTSKPLLVIPGDKVLVTKGVNRRLWFTVELPRGTLPGLYRGSVAIKPEKGDPFDYPVELTVHKGELDPLDIPVGPWGHTISLPWFEDDENTVRWNRSLTKQSLALLRRYGFTTFTGMPSLAFKGFEGSKPIIDFEAADQQMKMARQAGFDMPIVNYNRIGGFETYRIDHRVLRRSKFQDYPTVLKSIFGEITRHGKERNWLPVYWNLADEPMGATLDAAVENARAYRKAFPAGPPWFTGATSYASKGPYSDEKNLQLALLFDVANLAEHDAKGVAKIRKKGGKWALYNGGDRWTFGIYMYKAAIEEMSFRLHWHFNKAVGDPFYPLDCREDDFAWAKATPSGGLLTSVELERDLREGIDDYRYLKTLSRLASASNDKNAKQLLARILGGFDIGDLDPAAVSGMPQWQEFRREVAQMIDKLRR